jgi:uncharacterized membrane protein YfcA
MDWPYIIPSGVAVVYLAGVIQGLTGFGFSLVTVPILVLFISPKTTVPIVLILTCVLNTMLFFGSRQWSDPRRVRPLVISGIAAVPVGALFLTVLDAGLLRLIIGSAIVLFASGFLAGFRREIRNEKRGFVSVGLISGLLNGSISVGGPPVILFLTNQGVAKRSFRANLVTYFMFLNLATIPAYYVGGLLNATVLRYAALLVPGMILGAVTGSRLVARVSEKGFRKITLIIVIAAGALSVLSGLRAL